MRIARVDLRRRTVSSYATGPMPAATRGDIADPMVYPAAQRAKRQTMVKRVLAALAVVSATTITMLGSSPGAAYASGANPAFHSNIQKWSLPIDNYLPDENIRDYAENILTSHCLYDSGVSWPVYNPADYIPPIYNRESRALFDISLARK